MKILKYIEFLKETENFSGHIIHDGDVDVSTFNYKYFKDCIKVAVCLHTIKRTKDRFLTKYEDYDTINDFEYLRNSIESDIDEKISDYIVAQKIIIDFVTDSKYYNGYKTDSFDNLRNLIDSNTEHARKLQGVINNLGVKKLIIEFKKDRYSIVTNPIRTKDELGNFKVMLYIRTVYYDGFKSKDSEDTLLYIKESEVIDDDTYILIID